MLYAAPAITIYSCCIAALLGACMGSFLNCAAWRIVQLCVQPRPLPLLRREALPPPRGG